MKQVIQNYRSGRLELSRRFGAATVDLSKVEDPVSCAETFSRNRGVDGVLICASTKSNAPVHQAARSACSLTSENQAR